MQENAAHKVEVVEVSASYEAHFNFTGVLREYFASVESSLDEASDEDIEAAVRDELEDFDFNKRAGRRIRLVVTRRQPPGGLQEAVRLIDDVPDAVMAEQYRRTILALFTAEDPETLETRLLSTHESFMSGADFIQLFCDLMPEQVRHAVQG